VLKDDERSILFSSHNTLDVEQISDQLMFIDRGRIVGLDDKEMFLDRWRRLTLDVPSHVHLHAPPGVTDVTRSDRTAIVTTSAYSAELEALYAQSGAIICEVQRLTLEEIFVATVMHNRRERGE
jgi:ABC-2 type transport system ATP-binding protein